MCKDELVGVVAAGRKERRGEKYESFRCVRGVVGAVGEGRRLLVKVSRVVEGVQLITTQLRPNVLLATYTIVRTVGRVVLGESSRAVALRSSHRGPLEEY